MSKNEWLKRAEERKELMAALTQRIPSVRERAAEVKKVVADIKKAVPDATVIVNCCTRDRIEVQDPVMAEHALNENKVKFKGKFQEADTVNKQGRMYTSKALEESIKKIAAEGQKAIPGQDNPLHERWQPPTQDEDVCIPIRPKTENEFIDLSAVKGSNSRYKEYDKLRLMEDAMVVYHVGRSEPRNDVQLMDISVVSSGGYPAGPVGCVGPQGPPGLPGADNLGDADDVEYFRKKLFNALKMPKEVARKLASEDIRFARQYERETGESLADWREISREEVEKAKLQKLEELKIQVMSQNPSYLGVPAPCFSESVCVGPQGYNPQQSYHNYQHVHNNSVQPPTPIRFHPDQIHHVTIGEDRRVFSVNVEVKPEKAEAFIEKLKAEFKKRAREDKRWKNIEAQAAESETWIDSMANIAAESYVALSAKMDKMCNEVFLDTTIMNTPPPEGIVGAGSLTITAPSPTLMADSMIGDSIVMSPSVMTPSDYNINIGGC